jgi:hypothetical protein
MVGAINPNTSTSIDDQKQRARDSAYMLNPGEPFPPESPVSSASPGSSFTSSPYTPTSRSSTGKKSSALPAGVIAGIVIATVGVIVLGALLFLLRRTLKEFHRRHKEHVSSPTAPGQSVPPYSPLSPLSTMSPRFSPLATAFNQSAPPLAQQFNSLVYPQELPAAENEVPRGPKF